MRITGLGASFVAGAALPGLVTAALTARAAAADSSDAARSDSSQAMIFKAASGVVAVGALLLGNRLVHGGLPQPVQAALLGAGFGGYFGGAIFAQVDTRLHAKEYRSDLDAANASLDATRAMFAQHGVKPDEGLNHLHVAIDRDFLNAGYMKVPVLPLEQIVFGVDPGSHNHFAQARDVGAHEFSHRVIHAIVPLAQSGEPGTVDESLADTFAAAVDTANWTIGETVAPEHARNMADPHSEHRLHVEGESVIPPATRSEYIQLPVTVDSGGRHINVGIPNRAAYLIGSAVGREKMAEIYVRALRMIPVSCTIAGLAQATHKAATEAYGPDSVEARAVDSAWTSIGYADSMK